MEQQYTGPWLGRGKVASGCCKTRLGRSRTVVSKRCSPKAREEMVRIRARFQPCRNHGKGSRGFSRWGCRG